VKTKKTFIQVGGKTWLLTGDAAKLEDDGSITVFGRGSNCINSGGEKIFPEEVEDALKSHPGIFDALVIGVPDERWGSRVSAVVKARDGVQLSLESVKEHCRQHIAGYKVPREVHLIDEVPRAPSGKPDYKTAKAYALAETGKVA
ncbi:MAG: AMP-binding enzyme, partial [Spongiibacteraceae bacterium]